MGSAGAGRCISGNVCASGKLSRHDARGQQAARGEEGALHCVNALYRLDAQTDRQLVNNIPNATTTQYIRTTKLGQQSSRGALAPFHSSPQLCTLGSSSEPRSEWGIRISKRLPTKRFAAQKPATNITTAKQQHHHHIHPHIIKMEYNTGAPAQGGMTGGRACYNCESHPLNIPPPAAARLLPARCRVCVGCYTRLSRRDANRAGHAHEPLSIPMRLRIAPR